MSVTKNLSFGHLLIGLLIVTGVGITVWDYNRWRHAERDRYGQGWSEKAEWAPAKDLTMLYANRTAGLRMRYPRGWKITENEKFKQSPPDGGAVVGEQREEIVRWESENGKARVVVWKQKINEDLVVIADREAKGMTREKEYINTEGANLIVVTWDDLEEIRQKTLATRGGELLVVEIICDRDAWSENALTFWEMYKTVILL